MADTTAPIPESRKGATASEELEWWLVLVDLAEARHRAAESARLPLHERIGFGRGAGDGKMARTELGRYLPGRFEPREPIETRTISADHFAFTAREDHVLLEVTARHPTYVNGKETKLAMLTEGDRIRTANEVLLYVTRRPKTMPALAHFPAALMGPFGGENGVAMFGASARYWKLMDDLAVAATTDKCILLMGESGSGKHPCARAIYKLSRYDGGPWIEENAPNLAETIAAKLLFGNTRNWLNGREEPSVGLLGAANHGVLFFDEMGDMHDEVQAMLLNVLQEKKFVVQGATKPTLIDLIVIAAMNKPLGAIRHDLRNRFHVVEVPPLRERREDIAVIARELIRLAKVRGDARAANLNNLPTVLDFIMGCELTGNVRELETLLLNGLHDLGKLKEDAPHPPVATVDAEEAKMVARVTALLREHKGNRAAVERALGKSRAWLRHFMETHGLS